MVECVNLFLEKPSFVKTLFIYEGANNRGNQATTR